MADPRATKQNQNQESMESWILKSDDELRSLSLKKFRAKGKEPQLTLNSLGVGHGSSPEDNRSEVIREWEVMYTTQNIQTKMMYHRGFLILSVCGSTYKQAMLFDASRSNIGSALLKKDLKIESGETIAFGGYLIEIGESRGDHKSFGDDFSRKCGGHSRLARTGVYSKSSPRTDFSAVEYYRSGIKNFEKISGQLNPLSLTLEGYAMKPTQCGNDKTDGTSGTGSPADKATPEQRNETHKRKSVVEEADERSLRKKRQQKESDFANDQDGVYFIRSEFDKHQLWFYGSNDVICELDFSLLAQEVAALPELSFECSSKGVVCFSVSHKTPLLINPHAEEVLQLPTITEPHGVMSSHFAVGICSNNAIKVLYVSHCPNKKGKLISAGFVLSVGIDETWRRLPVPCFEFCEHPVTEGEFIYWVSYSRDQLIVFDIRSEEFSSFTSPVRGDLVDLYGLVGLVERKELNEVVVTESEEDSSSGDGELWAGFEAERNKQAEGIEEEENLDDELWTGNFEAERNKQAEGIEEEENLDDELWAGNFEAERNKRAEEEENLDEEEDEAGGEAMGTEDEDSEDDGLEEVFDVEDYQIFSAGGHDNRGKITHLTSCGRVELVDFGAINKINPIGAYENYLFFQSLGNKMMKFFNLSTGVVGDFPYPAWGNEEIGIRARRSGNIHLPNSRRLAGLLTRRA